MHDFVFVSFYIICIVIKAKGRTNIELREKFILADGVSQGMVAFKSKPLVNPKTGEINSVGPITKVCICMTLACLMKLILIYFCA